MKQILRNVQTRHLVNASILSLVLDMLYTKYINASSIATFNWLSSVFGIIDLTIGCLLLLKTIHSDISYIPDEEDVLTIEKSFLIGNRLHTFGITVEHLYNKLENWKFCGTFFGSAVICLVSIVSLIRDFLLFFHMI